MVLISQDGLKAIEAADVKFFLILENRAKFNKITGEPTGEERSMLLANVAGEDAHNQ